MTTVLFACVHNAGRSQMAEAFFNAAVDPEKARALSAGTEPVERVHPEVVAVMAEVGVDLSFASPKRLTEDLAREAQRLITMGCGEACPYIPGLSREDWALDDPRGQSLHRVRALREEIRSRVDALILRHGWGR